MNEIERKLSIMSNKSRRTRRIVTIAAAGLLIATAMLVGASLIGFYYQQTGTVDVKSYITITDPTSNVYYAGWSETVTIGPFYAGYYEGYADYEYISDPYTIALDSSYPKDTATVYIHIKVTETPLYGGDTVPCTGGLTVEVWNNEATDQITLAPGASAQFTIHITADKDINANYEYGYTIKMDWNKPL